MSVHVRVRVVVLAVSAGAVDAIIFLNLFGIFTAHLSGDTTRLAIDLGNGNLGAGAFARLLVIVVFVIGVIVGVAALSAGATGRRARALLAVEMLCLVAILIVGTTAHDGGSLHFGDAAFYLLVMLAALAMGLQSALIRSVSGTSVHTTFVTGMLTALGEDTVAWLRNRGDSDARHRMGIHANIWAGYLAGGIAGTALTVEWEFWALVLPLALLAAMLAGAGVDHVADASNG